MSWTRTNPSDLKPGDLFRVIQYRIARTGLYRPDGAQGDVDRPAGTSTLSIGDRDIVERWEESPCWARLRDGLHTFWRDTWT